MDQSHQPEVGYKCGTSGKSIWGIPAPTSHTHLRHPSPDITHSSEASQPRHHTLIWGIPSPTSHTHLRHPSPDITHSSEASQPRHHTLIWGIPAPTSHTHLRHPSPDITHSSEASQPRHHTLIDNLPTKFSYNGWSFRFGVWVGILHPVGIWGHLQGENMIQSYNLFSPVMRLLDEWNSEETYHWDTMPYSFWSVAGDLLYAQLDRHGWTYQLGPLMYLKGVLLD